MGTKKAVQVEELIDERISVEQCKKAVVALTKYAQKLAEEREKTELISGKEENVWLVLSVKKTQPEKNLKPHKIPLAHPAVDPRTTSVCLITKDPQREYKDLLEQHGVKFISRVVGVAKLKGKFKPFEARRMLLNENGLFLADERVVPLMPGLLGKLFFQAKKQPIPVSLTKKDLKGELERAISSTYMHQNQGTCTSIKVGTVSQSPSQLLDNLKTALPAIVKRIHGGWENVQSFNLKTNSSVSLPIWSCELGSGDGMRWEVTKAGEDAVEVDSTAAEWTGVSAEDKQLEGSETKVRKGKRKAGDGDGVDNAGDDVPKKGKGKKLAVEEASGTPTKKAKKADSLSVELPAVSDISKKEKKKAKAQPTVANEDEAATPDLLVTKSPKSKSKSKPSAPAPVPQQKSKSEKTDPSAKVDISVSELKKKRSSTGVEKKKGVALKSKSEKSASTKAKESLVGKASKMRT